MDLLFIAPKVIIVLGAIWAYSEWRKNRDKVWLQFFVLTCIELALSAWRLIDDKFFFYPDSAYLINYLATQTIGVCIIAAFIFFGLQIFLGRRATIIMLVALPILLLLTLGYRYALPVQNLPIVIDDLEKVNQIQGQINDLQFQLDEVKKMLPN